MERTRKRLEENSKKKQKPGKQQNKTATETPDDPVSSSPEVSVKYENRYEVLEDLAFGRMSFQGFNPEVEELMKFYSDLKSGKIEDPSAQAIETDEFVCGEGDAKDGSGWQLTTSQSTYA
ncbi:unnamed protein product [Gongylonema pulchrum]|uniref:Histone acetyltransferase n=1 Tax=Gongylonema pulchrum TaxID=637853 RepID=A0A183DRT5_9BILA|nr:unnamed protein product [Gongylonema pulchrum]